MPHKTEKGKREVVSERDASEMLVEKVWNITITWGDTEPAALVVNTYIYHTLKNRLKVWLLNRISPFKISWGGIHVE